MKNIIFILFIGLSSLSFAQSFEANPRFMTVPKYANQAAINSAIPSPTEGMLVYNISLDQYIYYTGSAWSSASAASGGSGTSLGIPVYANVATIEAIASPAIGWLVYNIQQAHVMIYTATGWKSLARTWLPNADDTQIRYMRGNVQLGSATSTLPGELLINYSTSSFTAPHLAFRSTSANVIRFTDGTTGNITQAITHSAAPTTARIQWRHSQGSTTTPMMTLFANGNATIEGFAKIGGTTADIPAVKTKLLTVASTTATTTVAHGLGAASAAKIIGLNAIIDNSGVAIFPNDWSSGNTYRASVKGANVELTTVPTGLQGKTARIYITYIE